MIKTKLLTFLFLISLSHFAFGQRLASYDCEVKFKINDSIEKRGTKVEKIDFLVEEEYTQSENVEVSIYYDTISKEFTFRAIFMTFGAYYYRKYKCPEIYINVIFNGTEKLIPVYFECAQSTAGRQQYDLGLIDLNHFLVPILKKEGKVDLIETPPYEIIEVKADKSIHKLRENEYEPRPKNKLVKLELQDEN